MRQVFAHDAVVAMLGEDDARAPGAAITAALCGHWEHDPPCPLAPHHTTAVRDGAFVRLRVLFAADPGDEPEVRRRIDAALVRAELATPAGTLARWRLVNTEAGVIRPDEGGHGRRLTASGCGG